MMATMPSPLIGPDDPAPFALLNAAGGSPFLLTADHAGQAIPRALGTLGLPAEERARHIGWDIGVPGLGARLSALLDAPLVHQPYSRLVIDCNRDPADASAIPLVSDGTAIPGNAALSSAERAARVAAIHEPYHAGIEALIATRAARGQPSLFIALHSFTPAMGGVARPWPVGVLHGGGDEALALALLDALRAELGEGVGDNAPYAMDGTDYSVPRHAFAARRPYAEIEVRQDEMADEAGQALWAKRLAIALMRAGRAIGLLP